MVVVSSTFLGMVGFKVDIILALTVVIVAVVSAFTVDVVVIVVAEVDDFGISVVVLFNLISAVVSKSVVNTVVGILVSLNVVVVCVINIGAFNGGFVVKPKLLVLVVSICIDAMLGTIVCDTLPSRNSLRIMSDVLPIVRFGAGDTLSDDEFIGIGVIVSSVFVSNVVVGVDVNGFVSVVVSTNEMIVVGSEVDDGLIWMGFWEKVLSIGIVCLSKRADSSLI